MSEYPEEIIIRGKEYRPTETPIFEKRSTGDAGEVLDVLGGIAGVGTGGDNYVRLWETGDQVAGIFPVQDAHREYVDEQWSYLHAKDGKPCNIVEAGVFLFKTRLAASQTIVKGDGLEPVTKTPTVQLKASGPLVARAAESKTTTGSVAWIKAWNLINTT